METFDKFYPLSWMEHKLKGEVIWQFPPVRRLAVIRTITAPLLPLQVRGGGEERRGKQNSFLILRGDWSFTLTLLLL